MIYTVTFNPAIDYVLNIENIEFGKTNRSLKEEMYIGGKGINVSIVLKNLGIDSKCLGFCGGFVGKEISKTLEEMGCNCDFIEVEQNSRINIKIKSNEETEINAQGPNISQDKIDELFLKLDNIKEGSILVLAGSIPNTLPSDIYEKIQERLKNKDIKIVVDATKNLLLNSLKYKPFLVKPNKDELSEIFNVEIKDDNDLLTYSKKLKEYGAKNVIVSLGKDGAFLLDENDKVYRLNAPEGVLINSVGAGDSMVAGFIYGFIKYNDYEKAFKYSVATGSATAFSKWLAESETINSIFNKL
ncbi:1-phosphofructokinase [[Clostridium] colinum]|uniref:1-phosphofructokinase n=1 Tax=[Clostridium] colinum TaxID=36835 RepID=UPI002024977F|nr:1-phosphofructokinase [[Clostridium] colinum]